MKVLVSKYTYDKIMKLLVNKKEIRFMKAHLDYYRNIKYTTGKMGELTATRVEHKES